MLKKSVGNMYDFVSHMWGPIKGKCLHDCSYCYMKKYPLGKAHLDEKYLKDNLGENNFIFVGHTIDLFAENIPTEWIKRVLDHCNKYPTNKYLFQSKNTARFLDFANDYPPTCVFGTTIETNREDYVISKAPSYYDRVLNLSIMGSNGYETIVTIEPIFDFDLEELVDLIVVADATWINIGADSKGHDLPEPSKDQIIELINELKSRTDVKLKDNLKRIIGDVK